MYKRGRIIVPPPLTGFYEGVHEEIVFKKGPAHGKVSFCFCSYYCFKIDF